MSNFKLLVVDDEPEFAEFVTDVAENINFDVISTSDPMEFAALYISDLNVIVLDLFMPKIDGIELLRYMFDCNCKASIIFMSGKDIGVLHSAQNIAEELGMTVLGVLTKPFFVNQLEELLAKYVLYTSTTTTNTPELPSISDIRTAIDNEELYLVYQPQLKISDRAVLGVEALVRWEHPTRGLIPPGIFIPIAEENNLISDITSFVNKTAIRQQGEWLKAGIDLRMSINMSPKILDDLELPEKLTAYAIEVGASIENINIEVTETALMSDVVRYMDILTRLKMKGFTLSIDDFGTGYSSLQQLVRIPFNELKIDQAFINKIDTDKDCRTICEISILLAHKLDMTVIAEGIESEAVWKILKELGCDEGQGYWMGMPMLPNEIEPWIENWYSN